jgi:ATP-dependent RNA helicase RhlE
VITPTRELAAQVSGNIRAYGRHVSLHTESVVGGMGMVPQIKALRRGVDILVCTPGRLLDHVERRTVNLSKVEILVLDEADRMLDMGFIPDIRRIIRLLRPKRQNLLFSATFPPEIRRLADSLLRDPARIQIARSNSAAESIRQIAYSVDRSDKRRLLIHLIKSNNWQQILLFVNMKHTASRLARQLSKEGIHASAIHGDKTQPQRTRALEDFKENKLRVLVATDLASRGLDIDQLPHVVNFELPEMPENYIHRIGRTGRAGNDGEAVSLVAPDEDALLEDIEYLINMEIPSITLEGFEPDPRITHVQPARRHRVQRVPESATIAADEEQPHVHWSKRGVVVKRRGRLGSEV